MKKAPDRRGLRAMFSSVFVRCAAVMALTTIVVATVLAVQSTRLVNTLAHQRVQEIAASTVLIEADLLAAPLKFKALPKIEESLGNVMRSAGDAGLAAVVFDPEGRVVSEISTGTEDKEGLKALAAQSLKSQEIERSENGLVVAQPIRTNADAPVVGVLAMEWTDRHALADVQSQKANIVFWAMGVFLVMCILTLLLLRRLLGVPLDQLKSAVARVADGDYDSDVPLQKRRDELGVISRRLSLLVEKLGEGVKAEQLRARSHEEQAKVVEALGASLKALALGDLRKTLEHEFPPDYDSLRRDYNKAVVALSDVVAKVTENAGSIRSGSDEIASASDDLARRTESQAATLEQTAAALEELLQSVKSAAENASNADSEVRNVCTLASEKGEVMQQAVGAMAAIEKSSGQIGDIITVIDDIAFQTNLLALNAGVEAARAGTSGKGFAVVASEVRALAQRSSDAARQIKDLIIGSAEEVQNGVRLVERAGEALEDVIERVSGISELVTEISRTSAEQAQGLNEINAGVSTLDGVTQRNAAMVEEATAAAHLLRNEAISLGDLMAQFKSVSSGTSQFDAPPVHEEATKMRIAS